MDYKDLKELVRQESTKSEGYLVMTNVIKNIRSYLSDLTKQIMDDLDLQYPESAISTSGNANNTSAGITIGKRQINFNYQGEGKVKVSCYESRVMDNTLIDTLIYKGNGKVVHEDTEEPFELLDINEYLKWFDK